MSSMRSNGGIALVSGGGLFVVMYAARVWYSGEVLFGFLMWNLWLAAVPWLCAAALERHLARASGASLIAWMLGAMWLLFLPNAPYVLTDFVHLRARPPVPLWYDVLMLGAAALTGLLAGAFSLAQIEWCVARSAGPRVGRAVVAAALPSSGFGIYLGRFERFNSWDALLHPTRVLRGVIAEPSARSLVVTVVSAALFAVAYLAIASPLPSSRRLPTRRPPGRTDRGSGRPGASSGRAPGRLARYCDHVRPAGLRFPLAREGGA